jgi:membrane-associated phospholipid phosphatase
LFYILRGIVFNLRVSDKPTIPILDDGDVAARIRKVRLVAFVWLALLASCLALDARAVTFVRDHVFSNELRPLLRAFWWFGHIGVTVGIAVVLCFFHAWRWRAGAYLLVSGLVGAALYALIKWGVGRIRPFKGIEAFDLQPFGGGLRGLFIGVPNATFPSGHATLVFLTASCLHRLYPRWGRAFYGLATLVGVSRLVRGAHYPSDIVAGAAVGVFAAWFVWRAGCRYGLIPDAIPARASTATPDAVASCAA